MKDDPYAFFLDSSLADGRLGRWSFMGSGPFLTFKSKKDACILEWKDGKTEKIRANPFLVLKAIFRRFRTPRRHGGSPFVSGGVGYFAYDLKDFVEKLPDLAKDDLDLPDCMMGFYDSVRAIDHFKSGTHTRDKSFFFNPAPPLSIRSNFTKASYEAAITRAKEYIKKGDIYQVNLSQRFEAAFEGDPFQLYSDLRGINPAPFSAYLNFSDAVIASSSPERFLKIDGSYIETRPVKGTRPRGRNSAEDEKLARELAASPKDRAEHVMIVDLERNDLGRVCRYGSVKPTEFIALERYSTVHHLVSTVSGVLKEGIAPIDCLMAVFPGGSITGAPKIRSMEIIEELEPVKRSVYTGSIGYIDFSGNMDTSIVIRTFVIRNGRAYFQAGGGIVADSDPGAEYQETIDKARALVASLGAAQYQMA